MLHDRGKYHLDVWKVTEGWKLSIVATDKLEGPVAERFFTYSYDAELACFDGLGPWDSEQVALDYGDMLMERAVCFSCGDLLPIKDGLVSGYSIEAVQFSLPDCVIEKYDYSSPQPGFCCEACAVQMGRQA